jgi:hypothetical protein
MSPPPGLSELSPEPAPDPSARAAKPRAFKARRVAAALSVATGLVLGGVMAATDASGSSPKATTATTRSSPGERDDNGRGPTQYSPDYGPSNGANGGLPHTRSGGS